MNAKRIFELAKQGLQTEINAMSKLDIECIEITGEHNIYYWSHMQRLIAEMHRLEETAEKYESKEL